MRQSDNFDVPNILKVNHDRDIILKSMAVLAMMNFVGANFKNPSADLDLRTKDVQTKYKYGQEALYALTTVYLLESGILDALIQFLTEVSEHTKVENELKKRGY